MTAIAVVGLGAMGSRIARRLLEGGHDVVVWNRTPGRIEPLVRLGATAAASPANAARQAEIVIAMVTDGAALRAVSEGEEGIAAGVDGAKTVVQMSTVGSPAVARLASALPSGTLLDAPVLGSTGEVDTGSLTIFAGGSVELVERARPTLSLLGTVLHVGSVGAGQAAKLVANATLFGTLGTLGEAIVLGRGLELSDGAVFEVLAATPLAAQAERRREAIQTGEYPPRFGVALARKDADLIRDAAASVGVDLRLLESARTWLAETEAAGAPDRDYSAVLATILAGVERRDDVAHSPHAYDGLIIDLDGVVWLGGEAIAGAADAIARVRARGGRVLFLTNDPTRTRDELAARLTAIGIPATAADVLTSAAATARFLASRGDLAGSPALVVGAPALRQEVEAAGFDVVPHAEARRAEIVVLGGHEGFDYAELQAATTAIAHGAALFATGRDTVVPTRDGPVPATGAILAAVETGTGVAAVVIGKPEPFVFEVARELLRDCESVAVVGDNLASDVVGAKRAGLDAILVLTGTASEEDLAHARIRPDVILRSLAELEA